jgi:hypothetical protein
MRGVWPVGICNGVLLACYFVPTWAMAAYRIAEAPVRGLYSRANIAPTIFFSDTFQLGAVGVGRLAWLLALCKLTVAAFFLYFLVLALRSLIVGKDDSAEPLAVALIFGGLVSLASMVCAVEVRDLDALRLHATESLMLLGATVVLLVEDARHDVVAPTVRPTAI